MTGQDVRTDRYIGVCRFWDFGWGGKDEGFVLLVSCQMQVPGRFTARARARAGSLRIHD